MALDLNDKSPNGFNLTNVNTVSEITTNLPFSQSSTAAGFVAASSQRFTIVDASGLKPGGNFTVECWFKSTTTGIVHRLFASYTQNTAVAGFELIVTTANKLRLVSGKSSGTVLGTDYQYAESATSVADGTWHHCAGVYDGTSLIVYVDGSNDGSTSWANSAIFATPNYVRIGCDNLTGTDTNFTDGIIDDVRLWSVARTASQISTNYNVELLGTETSLNGYWPFESILGGTTTSTTTSTSTSSSTSTSTSTTTSTSTSTTSTSSSTTITTTSTSTTSTSTSTTSTSTSTTSTSSSTTQTTSSTSTSTTTSTSTSTTTTVAFVFSVEGI